MLFVFRDAESFFGYMIVVASNLAAAEKALANPDAYHWIGNQNANNWRGRFALLCQLEIPGLKKGEQR